MAWARGSSFTLAGFVQALDTAVPPIILQADAFTVTTVVLSLMSPIQVERRERMLALGMEEDLWCALARMEGETWYTSPVNRSH